MQIAIYGPGRIGSTFAYHLAKSGHQVTVIARGERLAQLTRDGGVTTVKNDHAPVTIAAALEPTIEWDLVLVTVLATQVEAIMPQLRASRAKTIMFMFNTFGALDPLRSAVGPERAAFGFPAIIAHFVEGKLEHQIVTAGQITTTDREDWARIFTESGILTVLDRDMQSWLRSHAAFVVPLMAIGDLVHREKRGITMDEAKRYARAWSEGFRLVKKLGHKIAPAALVPASYFPEFVLTPMFWALSRSSPIKKVGQFGPGEARMLIDQMTKLSPDGTEALLSARP